MPLHFIRSVKGSVLLYNDGFLYERDKETDKTYWRCIKYKTYSCGGRVHTKGEQIVFDNNAHNHLEDSAEAEAKRIRLEVKKRAITNVSENSGTIVAKVLEGISEKVAVQLPSVDCLRRLACRARSKVYPRATKMNGDDVRCPICSRMYSRGEIEEHANKCLFLNEPAQKRPATELESSSTSPRVQKRIKQEPSKNVMSSPVMQKPTVSKITQEPPPVNNPISQPQKQKSNVPLAERMRPANLDSYVGQSHILTPGSIMYTVLKNAKIPNVILWGPAGCGKTSLANVIGTLCKQNPRKSIRFVKLSAAMVGVNEVKEQVKVASNELKFNRQTIIFMDEIHRFNKMQQDIFLPHVEAGTITLIGATTENPSFSLNSALLSRCRVLVLEKLSTDNLTAILNKAVEFLEGSIESSILDLESPIENEDESTNGKKFVIDRDTIQWLAETCDGDARIALGGLELAMQSVTSSDDEETNEKTAPKITLENIKAGLLKSHRLYDRKGDEHYNMISALHKSVRASDDNAALYWLARMMAGGEDPVYIARRLVRMATEDIGLADPNALGIAVHTMHACKMIGMPECDVPLAQCVTYLARAPKSRLMEDALRAAQKLVAEQKGSEPGVPLHLRNAPTKLMRDLRFGNGYNMLNKDISGLTYMPEGLEEVDFFSS